MQKRKSYGLSWVLLAALLIANMMVGVRLYSQEASNVASSEKDAYGNIALFTRVLEIVRRNYVDEEKTSYKDLIRGALSGVLSSLDPHCQYLDPDMYRDMKDDTAGKFGGVGIVISIKNGVLTIVAPMEDTPGFRAGLMSGDKIIEIDGESCEGISLSGAVKLLRGKPGTTVLLKVLRQAEQDIHEVEITRAIIAVASVKDAEILDDKIGYVRIVQFNEPTADALRDAVNDLLDQDMNALIIDLRNNPGGLLSSAVDVTEQFLKRGEVVVSTRGRNEQEDTTFKSRGRRHFLDFPMVLLANGGSASAAEIFCGALQDHKRAILVGEQTFGKGSVQSVLPLGDDAAIRITTARYYTPSDRMINGVGLEPDIVVPMSPEIQRALLIRRSSVNGENIVDESAVAETVVDIQLERAIDILKGILLFNSDS